MWSGAKLLHKLVCSSLTHHRCNHIFGPKTQLTILRKHSFLVLVDLEISFFSLNVVFLNFGINLFYSDCSFIP